jgi:hypothetical protein
VFTISRVVVRALNTDPSIEQAIQLAVQNQKRLEAKKIEVEIAAKDAENEIARARRDPSRRSPSSWGSLATAERTIRPARRVEANPAGQFVAAAPLPAVGRNAAIARSNSSAERSPVCNSPMRPSTSRPFGSIR